MKWPGPERWLALCNLLGAAGNAEAWYSRLTAAYSEPQRSYHNGQHIGECMAVLDQSRDLAIRPEAVELALWFHDAVYDPKAKDNEEQSAVMARQFCMESKLDDGLSGKVYRLIMATKTHQGTDPDTILMIDIDLSILGQNPDRFLQYEAQIRSEYAWVPEDVFRQKRSEILKSFLERNLLFGTPQFREKYESAARRNLQMSIDLLGRSV